MVTGSKPGYETVHIRFTKKLGTVEEQLNVKVSPIQWLPVLESSEALRYAVFINNKQ